MLPPRLTESTHSVYAVVLQMRWRLLLLSQPLEEVWILLIKDSCKLVQLALIQPGQVLLCPQSYQQIHLQKPTLLASVQQGIDQCLLSQLGGLGVWLGLLLNCVRVEGYLSCTCGSTAIYCLSLQRVSCFLLEGQTRKGPVSTARPGLALVASLQLTNLGRSLKAAPCSPA